jgi:class 3 adenylate cyclase
MVAGVSFVFRCPGSETESHLTARDATSCDVREARCWLLVADLEDSTAWSRDLPPSELGLTVQRQLRDCRTAVQRHAGHINRYLGDSLLAFWSDADPSAASVAATLGDLHQLRVGPRPPFRVVVHCGTIVFAGSLSTGEENLLGPDVTFIFRLEKIAAQLREPFVVSAAAAAALRAHLALDSLGTHEVRDCAGRQECFRVRLG